MKKMLSEKEIIKIIKEKLPELITKHPSLRIKIEEIIEKKAVTKEEIKEILLELRNQREENNKRFEEINRRFEEINKRFEEMGKRMENGFKILRDTISAIGSRWGIGAEEAFRKGFEEVLSEIGYKVIKWKKFDKNAEFFIFPRSAEIDILIRDDKKIAIEVKSSLSLDDLEGFEKTVRFYEKEEKVKVDEKIIVAIFSRKGVEEFAKGLKIKIIKGLEEAKEYLSF